MHAVGAVENAETGRDRQRKAEKGAAAVADSQDETFVL